VPDDGALLGDESVAGAPAECVPLEEVAIDAAVLGLDNLDAAGCADSAGAMGVMDEMLLIGMAFPLVSGQPVLNFFVDKYSQDFSQIGG
jgi:hypothetical protein